MSETETVRTLDAFPQTFDEAVKAGVASGDLVLETNKVSAKDSDSGVTGEMSYQRVVAKTEQGALILAGGSWDRLKDMVTIQFDTPVRANVRNAILRSIEGPEKTLRQIAEKVAKKYGKNADEVFAELKANPGLVAILS